MKTSELTGPALDWAVTYALYGEQAHYIFKHSRLSCRYATTWSQGGPIIDREAIAIDYDHDVWNAAKYGLHRYISGPTPLIAAMRCFVASKLGDEVEIPKELA